MHNLPLALGAVLAALHGMEINGELKAHLENGIAHLRFRESPTEIFLGTVFVPKDSRGQGIGTALMNRLLAVADVFEKPVRLEARPIGTTSSDALQRLVTYYQQLGFIVLSRRAGNVLMERPARKNEHASAESPDRVHT